MTLYQKNKNLLKKNHSYNESMEHDACGVGMIASTNGKKSRKIVVATNIAETSLTIPGIRIVIDSGIAKIFNFDSNREINTLLPEKICRSSADQRSGRAGRTSPGVCIRLWSELDHRERPKFIEAEIHRLDLSELFLTLLSRGLKPEKLECIQTCTEQSPGRATRFFLHFYFL